MRSLGDTVIVAVDAGYGNMKTASCCFPSGLVATEERPYFTENLLVYEGRYYQIGVGHKEFVDRKILDEDYYLLTLAAIAGELAVYHRTETRVLLAVVLPLTWMARQRSAYREYLLKKRSLSFQFRGVEYSVELEDVMVFPQGYAAVSDRLNELRDVNIVADIGNGTVNLFRVVNRKVDLRSMTTEAIGVKDCAVAMRQALANEHSGARVDDSVIERVIRTGTAKIEGAYLTTLQQAARQYTERLLRSIREFGYDGKTAQLVVLGGGGCLLRNFADLDGSPVTFIGDIHANARGYERLAYEKLRRGGEKQ